MAEDMPPVGLVRLAAADIGDKGVITQVRAEDAGDLERRLLEFGFVEGACLEVLHEGALARDPLAVRVDDMRVALRRRDAAGIWFRKDPA
jgi:ferrous iron transport protein A